MTRKNLKILFLYPNFHMSTLVPNGIAILVAWLKRDGFKNIDLFRLWDILNFIWLFYYFNFAVSMHFWIDYFLPCLQLHGSSKNRK